MIEQLFQELHGSLEKKTLVPITSITEEIKQMYVDRVQFPSYDELQQIESLLGVSLEQVYFNPNFTMTPFVYYSQLALLDIHQLSVAYLHMMDMGKRIQQFETYLTTLLQNKEYEQLFHMVDKRALFEVYHGLYPQLPDAEKYLIFRSLYVRSEYGFSAITPSFLKEVQQFKGNDCEKEKLKNLMDSKGYITIYRGQTNQSTPLHLAYSWTTDPSVAAFFAHRFDSEGEIVERKVQVQHVIDYIEDRGEQEILVLPEHVKENK